MAPAMRLPFLISARTILKRSADGRGGVSAAAGTPVRVLRIDVYVDCRHAGVGLDLCARAVEFDGLLGTCQRVDGCAQDVRLRVLVEFATGLLKFVELWLVLESVEQEHAAFLGETQAGGHVRGAGLFRFLLGFQFLVELDGLRRRRSLQAALLVFVGGVPVNEVLGNLLPFAALGAVVADAVSLISYFAASW
jgi:hypothetical protein